jgi:threonine dehydratase
MTIAPTFDDITSAARQIAGVAHRTPVFTSRTVNRRTGADVFFKCENFQRAGAFKFRGAYNALSLLTPDRQRRGVVAFSSGNHAQAVALAAQILGVPAVIVMPTDAPEVKQTATREYGAEIVFYDRDLDDREAIGARLAEERGLTLVPPFNHPHVIAGAGTAALELLDAVPNLDLLIVPCGGGGLLSGSALSAAARAPHCRVIGVEPQSADDAVRSFRTGVLQTVHNPPTIADGARTASLGSITFPIVLQLVSDMTTVDDAALLRTMFFLWERLKLVVEPTGALGAAAVLGQTVDVRGARVGVILSGGNCDLRQIGTWFRELLQ